MTSYPTFPNGRLENAQHLPYSMIQDICNDEDNDNDNDNEFVVSQGPIIFSE